MKKFDVCISDYVEYLEIEAETEEEAIAQAWEWWVCRSPDFRVEVSEEEDE